MGWSKLDLEQRKIEIKNELDQVLSKAGPEAKLRCSMEKFNSLRENLASESQLNAFVYAMSSIVHHLHFDGLNEATVNKLVDECRGILQLQGIQPTNSELSGLHGELHLVVGQMRLKEGRNFSACWEQYLSVQFAGKDATPSKAYLAFSRGLRCHRLGLMRLAYEEFCFASDHGLPEAFLGRCHINQVRSLRLCGETQKAADLASLNLPFELKGPEHVELLWETLLCRAIEFGHCNEILLAIEKTGTHHIPTYVLEAFLWSHASDRLLWTSSKPSITHLKKTKYLSKFELGYAVQAASIIDMCYDDRIPLGKRLASLGGMLEKVHLCKLADQELLIWACAVKFLKLTASKELLHFAQAQFAALNFRLSSGTTDDVLSFFNSSTPSPRLTRHAS